MDPVCGMAVDPTTAAAKVEHGGREYLFCSAHCAERFRRDPAPFLAGKREPMEPAPPAPAGTVWVCPMDPEVREAEPGPCPVCGMALEPLSPAAAAAEEESPEYRDMRRRLLVSIAFTAPLLVFAMGPMLGVPLPHLPWVQAALSAPVVLGCGLPFFERGWRSLATGRLNMFTLIALGTGTAFLFSLAGAAVPDAFPASFRHHGEVPLYFESAAVIVSLVLLGQVLELRARAKTGGALRALLRLAPATARRVGPGDAEEEVPRDAVRAGDLLRVRPGESVPTDGTVVEGTSTVDESMVTGESIPVDRGPGDRVTGGTLNATGAFVMRADRVGADTLLARIVRLVSEAQRSRAPVQALADRAAAIFVPTVVGIAVLSFAGWALRGPEPRLANGLVAAVSVLLIACPCALGLATPVSLVVGMGRGAAAGVLFRDASALEVLGRVDTLAVDKTGTLTAGRPEVVAVAAAGGDGESSRAVVLQRAAAVERWSEHPLAKAVLREAERRNLAVPATGTFRNMPGKGAAASLDGRAVAVGNRALLADMDLVPGEMEARALEEEARGRTVMFVVAGGQVIGLLALADTVRPTTPEALRGLREAGVGVVMLTGDSKAAAGAVARDLGIERVEAGVSPERKEEVVRRLGEEGRIVAMAGDGVNDAPALARAAVGIAMGTGTDAAMESAGVALVRGDLRGILRARRLSRAVMANIRQNLWLAFGYNALAVPVAALGLLNPMIAAAAMSLSSVSVLSNALRLRRHPM